MSWKLPNFLHDGFFNALRHNMGAPLTDSFKVARIFVPIELPIAERLQGEGIDVRFDEITVLQDGTLGYKGHRVLLYIRDVHNYGERGRGLPKFHVSFCSTLDTMKRDKRFGRYVVANRQDGFFLVNIMGQGQPKGEPLPLDVCQQCLANLGWKGFTYSLEREDRQASVKQFKLAEFFEHYPRDLIYERPAYTSDTAPLNEYAENWGDISEAAKTAAKFTCRSCQIRLTDSHRRYLHVHHINGLKHDNSPDNLEVLCIACHAEEPQHGHMKSSPDYIQFMQIKHRPFSTTSD